MRLHSASEPFWGGRENILDNLDTATRQSAFFEIATRFLFYKLSITR
jgi:hypothetical protein